jgi:hypothetical protein
MAAVHEGAGCIVPAEKSVSRLQWRMQGDPVGRLVRRSRRDNATGALIQIGLLN